jgi:hypothetical protein
MLSELGSHPGLAGNLLFVWDPDSTVVKYDFQGAVPARGYWSAAAIVHLWSTCEAVADTFNWNDWINHEARPIYEGLAMAEALKRYQAQRQV